MSVEDVGFAQLCKYEAKAPAVAGAVDSTATTWFWRIAPLGALGAIFGTALIVSAKNRSDQLKVIKSEALAELPKKGLEATVLAVDIKTKDKSLGDEITLEAASLVMQRGDLTQAEDMVLRRFSPRLESIATQLSKGRVAPREMVGQVFSKPEGIENLDRLLAGEISPATFKTRVAGQLRNAARDISRSKKGLLKSKKTELIPEDELYPMLAANAPPLVIYETGPDGQPDLNKPKRLRFEFVVQGDKVLERLIDPATGADYVDPRTGATRSRLIPRPVREVDRREIQMPEGEDGSDFAETIAADDVTPDELSDLWTTTTETDLLVKKLDKLGVPIDQIYSYLSVKQSDNPKFAMEQEVRKLGKKVPEAEGAQLEARIRSQHEYIEKLLRSQFSDVPLTKAMLDDLRGSLHVQERLRKEIYRLSEDIKKAHKSGDKAKVGKLIEKANAAKNRLDRVRHSLRTQLGIKATMPEDRRTHGFGAVFGVPVENEAPTFEQVLSPETIARGKEIAGRARTVVTSEDLERQKLMLGRNYAAARQKVLESVNRLPASRDAELAALARIEQQMNLELENLSALGQRWEDQQILDRFDALRGRALATPVGLLPQWGFNPPEFVGPVEDPQNLRARLETSSEAVQRLDREAEAARKRLAELDTRSPIRPEAATRLDAQARARTELQVSKIKMGETKREPSTSDAAERQRRMREDKKAIDALAYEAASLVNLRKQRDLANAKVEDLKSDVEAAIELSKSPDLDDNAREKLSAEYEKRARKYVAEMERAKELDDRVAKKQEGLNIAGDQFVRAGRADILEQAKQLGQEIASDPGYAAGDK